jgi:predicted acyl esterase
MFIELLMKTISGRNQGEDVRAMVRKYPLMNDYWEDKNPNLNNIVVPLYVLASYSTSLHSEGSIRRWNYASSKENW